MSLVRYLFLSFYTPFFISICVLNALMWLFVYLCVCLFIPSLIELFMYIVINLCSSLLSFFPCVLPVSSFFHLLVSSSLSSSHYFVVYEFLALFPCFFLYDKVVSVFLCLIYFLRTSFRHLCCSFFLSYVLSRVPLSVFMYMLFLLVYL